jgi:hypothetical protein
MFLVYACPDKFVDRNVMARLAPGAGAVAERETKGSLEHGFVGLLKTGFLVKRENLLG